MKKNIISALLYVIIVSIYFRTNDSEIIYLYLCWLAGYSKGIWDYLD
jgi:hypothetical protein